MDKTQEYVGIIGTSGITKLEEIKNFLKGIDITELIDKIYDFDDVNFKYILPDELVDRICRTIGNGNGQIVLKNDYRIFKKGTRFYRIRKLKKEYYNEIIRNNFERDEKDGKVNCNLPKQVSFTEIQEEKDLWNPPTEIVKDWGRLNKPGESLLYLTPKVETATEEARIGENELFALAEFTLLEDIVVTCIGTKQEYDERFTKEEINKMKLIELFLKNQFCKEVGEGKEYLYKISEVLSKTFFTLQEGVDAWYYPSIANKNDECNICMLPETAHKKIVFDGVLIMSKGKDIKKKINLLCWYAGFLDENKKFEFWPVGSEKFLKKYPNIKQKTIISNNL